MRSWKVQTREHTVYVRHVMASFVNLSCEHWCCLSWSESKESESVYKKHDNCKLGMRHILHHNLQYLKMCIVVQSNWEEISLISAVCLLTQLLYRQVSEHICTVTPTVDLWAFPGLPACDIDSQNLHSYSRLTGWNCARMQTAVWKYHTDKRYRVPTLHTKIRCDYTSYHFPNQIFYPVWLSITSFFNNYQ